MANTQGVSPHALPNGALLPYDPTQVGSLPDQIGAGSLDSPLEPVQATRNALVDWYKRGGIAGTLGTTPVDEQLARAAPVSHSARDALHLDLSNPMLWALAPGIFGGVKSLTAPRAALSQAESLERLGVSRDDIHTLTGGLFQGAEGKWRYPISDEGAALNPLAFRSNQQHSGLVGLKPGVQPLSNVLSHPGGLFEAYPELGSYPVSHPPTKDINAGILGSFYPSSRRFELGGGRPENVLSTLLHETQHAVQNIEGFDRGGAMQYPPDFTMRAMQLKAKRAAFLKVLGEVHPELSGEGVNSIKNLLGGYPPTRQTVDTIRGLHPALQEELRPLAYEAGALRNQFQPAYDKYWRLAGEVEARAVQEQHRLGDWTTPIWQHTGYVPFEDQIVKTPVEHDPFAPAKLSLVPVEHDPFGQPTR